MQPAKPKVSFKAQMHQAREQAILQSACDLLGEKSFDTMTMDDVAGKVGIAKASLYKHFSSKEALCAAAMAETLCLAHSFLQTLDANAPPLEKLRAMVRWSLQRLLVSELPLLPGRNSTLRTVLMAHDAYARGVEQLSATVGFWIAQAQADGAIDPALPPQMVLYTLYARAGDPVVGFLKDSGQYQDEAIVELVLGSCFEGLRVR